MKCLTPLILLASTPVIGSTPVIASTPTVFSPTRILERTKILSSDEFEGRGPGTRGEEKTVEYLVAELQKLGLEPGNPDGTYIQKVPLVGITSHVTLDFDCGGQPLAFEPINDFVATSSRLDSRVAVKDSDLVFVGYGIVAPEFAWDDFKDVDLRGKTVVVLVNDPPLVDPSDPAQLDPKMFGGKAMTYYGRWTYKYEIAALKGAAACLIIHETGPASYPFAVVAGSWGRENFDLRTADRNVGGLAMQGWMTLDATRRLFAKTGHDFETLKKSALSRSFRPVSLGAKVTFAIDNQLRPVDSQNVVARLPGRDVAHRDEYVVYTAHWDHLGRDPRLVGDQIFNGAADNAGGVAVLLELARAFQTLPREERPSRSILFLFVTAEEKGLLGSRYYVQHPFYPLRQTLADINLDGVNQFGPTSDMETVGFGATTIDDIGIEVARAQHRVMKPHSHPERGGYYRSDHFEFAKAGVPAYRPVEGLTFIGKPAGWGEERVAEYIAHDYHKVSDEVKPDWTFEGAAQDAAFLFEVGRRIANDPVWPQWREGNEFKARRDAQLAR